MQPKVSIIIVNWNGLDHLQKCLGSIVNQSFKDFEIIFVDNGSKDESLNFVKSNFPQVHIIELEKNYGFAQANNIGINASKGEFIALVNNDTEAHQDWLKELVICIEKDKSIGLVNSKMLLFDKRDTLDNAGSDYSVAGCCFEKGRLEQDSESYSKDFPVLLVCAGAALYRRELFEKIGKFDENFFYSYEDVDLSLRAFWAGYNAVFCAKSIIYHKLQATRKKNSKLNTFYNQRNNSIVWYKNVPLSFKFKYILPRFVYNLGSLVKFVLEGNGGAFIKSKVDFYRLRKKLKMLKSDIEKNKVRSSADFKAVIKKDFFKNKLKKLLKG